MARICLVTPHHISFQPRALREADTLQEIGHQVRVVSRQQDSELTNNDLRLMSTRQWKLQSVDLRRDGPKTWTWFKEGVRARVATELYQHGVTDQKIAVTSYVRGFRRLVNLACSEPADWFIAHTQAALPVAVEAAKRTPARIGFDCEDLLTENGTDPAEIIRGIERENLPRCDYITTPSDVIARHLEQTYGLRARPVVLHNVFPLSLAKDLTAPFGRAQNPVLRLHWFGQTIGPRRGIEDAMRLLSMLPGKVELYLRGRISDGYRAELERSIPAGTKLSFLPVVDHDALIESLSEFDVGLALERQNQGNQSMTISNKIFSYMLSGLAIAATDTPGQREVMERIPEAGFLYEAGNARALANGILPWLESHERLRTAQMSSWMAARETFNWDRERQKFLDLLDGAHEVDAQQQRNAG